MKWLALCLLAGCAVNQPTVQRYDVPVMIKCITSYPVRPQYEFEVLETSSNDGDIVLALARDWPLGREYEAQLEAVIAGCL